MRLVLDTNVVASALLWDGAPARLLDAAKLGDLALFTSRPLLRELANILARPKFTKAIAASGQPLEALLLVYAELAEEVIPANLPPTITADLTDDQMPACALAAQADLIVSGDKHLLNLGQAYQSMRILSPAQALELFEGR